MKRIQLSTIKRRAREELFKLSPRERWLIVGAVAAIVFFVSWQTIEKVKMVMRNQDQKIESARQDLSDLRERFQRFSALQSKRRAIEEQFKEVGLKDGVKSHLEDLLKNKAGVSSGYAIKELPAVQFGGSYQQTPFSVKFTVASLDGLVSFLKELVEGANPLVVTELEIKRDPIGDKLRISVDVSSIRKADGGGEA